MNKLRILIAGEKNLCQLMEISVDLLLPHIEIFKAYNCQEALGILNSDRTLSIIIITEEIYKKIIVSLRSDDINKIIIISDNDDFINECHQQKIEAIKNDHDRERSLKEIFKYQKRM